MEPSAYREMAEVQDKHWWFRARREILQTIIGSLALPDSPELLEIGSGPGGNLPMLSQIGNVSAMEMDDYARSMAAQKMNGLIDIKYGRLPDEIPFEKHRFDLVCLFDVLEHVADDTAALSAIRELIKPGGQVLLTVPAYKWLWSKHDEKLHHQRRYSAHELSQKAVAAGWTTKRLTYFNTLLFPLALVTRVMDKLNPKGNAIGSTTPAGLINASLYQVFVREKAFLQRHDFPFGVSLLMVLTAQ